jgi:hypothetical protein
MAIARTLPSKNKMFMDGPVWRKSSGTFGSFGFAELKEDLASVQLQLDWADVQGGLPQFVSFLVSTTNGVSEGFCVTELCFRGYADFKLSDGSGPNMAEVHE